MDRQPFLITLGRTNVLIIIAAVSGTLGLFAAFILDVAHRQDAQAEDQAFSFVQTLLSDRAEALERSVIDYADSGAGYANLHLNVDLSWAYIQNNFGASLYEHQGIEYAAVIDPEGHERYSLVEGRIRFGPRVSSLEGGARALIEAARNLPEHEAVSGLLVSPDGEPILASASPLSPGDDHTVLRDDRRPSVIVFGDRLTQDELSGIEQELFVTDLGLKHRSWPRSGGEDHWFSTYDGEQHFVLHLKAPTPGRDMLEALAPGAATIVVILLGSLLLVALQGRRIAAMNRRSEQALEAAHRHAEHLALHDSVTGLPNRLSLARSVETAARGDASSMRILYLDLDRFKPINDYYGHAAGDLVLRTIASRIRATLNEDEIGGRIGGDEFVILARRADDEAVARLCRTLIALVARPVLYEDRALAVGVSIGVAALHPGERFEEAIHRADVALYEAKRSGRSCHRWAEGLGSPGIALVVGGQS